MANVVDVKFYKQELKTYAENSNSCVTLERKTRIIFLQPAQFSDMNAGIHENLDLLLLKYDFLFKAIMLGYEKIKILSRYGSICYGRSKVALQIEADFYLFNPAVGSKLQGVVCKRSGYHLGCLVYKAFNVSIPLNENSYISGWDFSIGQDITFTVIKLDLTSGPLPYIRGQLYIDESKCIDGDGNESQVTDSGFSHGNEDELDGDSGVAVSSPGKGNIESGRIEKEDESRPRLQESIGEIGVSTKTIANSTEKSKGKSKKKMKKSPHKSGEMIKELLKNMEMSFGEDEADEVKKEEPKELIEAEDEPKTVTTQPNTSLIKKSKSRASLDAVAKDSGKKKIRKSTSNVSFLSEEPKMSASIEPSSKDTASDKLPESSDITESYDSEIEKLILTKLQDMKKITEMDKSPCLLLSKNRASLDVVAKDSGKKKKKKSISNDDGDNIEGKITDPLVKSSITPNEKITVTSNIVNEGVENEVGKLVSMNKILLGKSQLGSDDIVRESNGSKGEESLNEEKRSKKRKRESKDVLESPQRSKVAKRLSEKLETPKVLDAVRTDSNLQLAKNDSPTKAVEQSSSSKRKSNASVIPLNLGTSSVSSEVSKSIQSPSITTSSPKITLPENNEKTDSQVTSPTSSSVRKSPKSHSRAKRKSIKAEKDLTLVNQTNKILLEIMRAHNM